MVLDTSAVLAVLLNEIEAQRFRLAIEDDAVRLLSAASLVEAAIIVEVRHGEPGGRELDLLVHKAAIQVMPVDEDQAELARVAYRRFGKGRHAANLNFGDCFSYALSKATGERLLFKGGDFRLTDVEAVEVPGSGDTSSA